MQNVHIVTDSNKLDYDLFSESAMISKPSFQRKSEFRALVEDIQQMHSSLDLIVLITDLGNLV